MTGQCTKFSTAPALPKPSAAKLTTRQQRTMGYGLRDLEIAKDDAPSHSEIEARRQARREVKSGRDQDCGRGRHTPDGRQGPKPPVASQQTAGHRRIGARNQGEDSDPIQPGESS